MIYVDTSVVLAHLLAEDRQPADALWGETLVSSRLLQYEVWTRLHARGLSATHGDAAGQVLGRIGYLELAPPVLERALEPFPVPVRTLDAMHLASMLFLKARHGKMALATYDERQRKAARRLSIETLDV